MSLVNARNTGYSGTASASEAEAGEPTTRWETSIESSENTPVIATDASLYFGDEHTVRALGRDGRDQWRYGTDGIVRGVAVAGDAVYAACELSKSNGDNGALVALDRKTGERRWRFATKHELLFEPSIVDGTAYLGTGGGTLMALDVGDGTERWSSSLGDGLGLVTTPAIAGGTGYVTKVAPYTSTEDPGVFAVDLATGGIRWRTETEHLSEIPTRVVDGRVSVSTVRSIRALSSTTGEIKWDVQNRTKQPIVSTQDEIFVASTYQTVECYDAETGSVVWDANLPGKPTGAPTLVGRSLLVPSSDGNLYAFNSNDGSVRWRFSVGRGREPSSSVTVVGSRLYLVVESDTQSVMLALNGSV